MKNKRETLWTKDFTCITTATILSAIGGEAMNLPISLLVFDETKSTLLAAILLICGMLPDIILPILVAPLIDKGGKKKWIVSLDLLLGIAYLAMGIWVADRSFSYTLYLVFVLFVGTISVFYRLAYQAWYPNLIPNGYEQKGYAVSSTIYPLITMTMAPVAAFLYEKVSMNQMFGLVAALSFASVLVEGIIREHIISNEEAYTFKSYCSDIREGFSYIKKEKGIRNIYTYMSITNGASDGVNVVTQAFFQTHPVYSVTMLGFLKTAEMLGRSISGFYQYKKQIPVKKRFLFTKGVYLFYDFMDTLLLFMPYPFMMGNRFLCGALGTTSATIRETAVQSYLPEHMRARVNAFFSVVMSLGGIFFQFLAGALGEVMSYQLAGMLLGLMTLCSVYFLIIRPAEDNRPVYEAVRMAKEDSL